VQNRGEVWNAAILIGKFKYAEKLWYRQIADVLVRSPPYCSGAHGRVATTARRNWEERKPVGSRLSGSDCYWNSHSMSFEHVVRAADKVIV